MNFKNIYLVIIALVFTLSTSCEDLKFGNDFLEKPPGGEMTIDSVYTKKVYVEQVLAQLYHTLPDYLPHANRLAWGILEDLTDLSEMIKSPPTSYHLGEISAALGGSAAYAMSYNEIHGEASAVYAFRLGHIFLENIDRAQDMTDDEKNVRKGEAKMIMALHYVQVFRNLGGMPWVDRSYTPDEEMKFVRMTIDEAVTNTCRLIDEAVALLPWSVEASDDGRMTAAAGLALKSRLLLFAASPLFNSDQPFMDGEASTKHNVWYGNYSADRWQDALTASLAFLTTNDNNGEFYRLVDTGDPRADFKNGYYTRYSKETIISGHRWDYAHNYGKAFVQFGYGAAVPTLNYADMFQMKNGEDFDWNDPEHKAHPFFKYELGTDGNPTIVNGRRVLIEVRDPRLYETLLVNEDVFRSSEPAQLYYGGKHGSVLSKDPPYNIPTTDMEGTLWGGKGYTGIAIRKFILDGTNELRGRLYQCPLLRLPEIYLNIAEAMNELGIASQTQGPDQLDAYDYVDLVRARVDMPPLDRSKISEGEQLREAILLERTLEFGFEEVRYYDMVRWKRSEEWLSVPLRRLITLNRPENKKVPFEHIISTNPSGYYESKRSWVDGWNNRYYLSPIPLAEINKKYGLVQNPGWEI